MKKKAAKPKRPTPAESKQAIIDDLIATLVRHGYDVWPDVDPEVVLGIGPWIRTALSVYMRAQRRR